VLQLGDALNMARAKGVDLVEIVPNANPPVCRLVDFGKFRYEMAKQDKETRKHQHANKVKEVQLSPNIDQHDLSVKLQHATTFLCEDMKVKITLRFRGREMAHTQFGFQVVDKFTKELLPFSHPDSPPKLIGKGINVMMSPLPRNKRAKNPFEAQKEALLASGEAESEKAEAESKAEEAEENKAQAEAGASSQTFGNNAFENLNLDAK